KALAALSKAIQLEPKEAWAWYNRGVVHDRLGRLDKALADYTSAIELDREDVRAWNNRGALHSKRGHWEKAVADYYRALEVNAKDRKVRTNRGAAYAALGQWDKAAADLAPQGTKPELTLGVGVQLAGLQVLTGQAKRYQELCRLLAPIVEKAKNAD